MRGLQRYLGIALLALSLCLAGRPSVAPAAETTRNFTVVRGTLLTIEHGYLVFTTGDAVRLDPTLVPPPGPLLGRPVRVLIDPQSRLVTAVQLDPGAPFPQEIDAAALPRGLVAVEPASAQTTPQLAAQNGGQPAVITLDVRVPDDTPPNDDVYLSSDRTNYNPAELRLNRVDAHRWTVTFPVAPGATVHYQFTRGSASTVERTISGGIVTPRTLDGSSSPRVSIVIARWADSR